VISKIPTDILEAATQLAVKAETRGRPRCLSKLELQIVEHMKAQDEGAVVMFSNFSAETADNMMAYKRALVKVQDPTTLLSETLEELGVSVFKQRSKTFLWKQGAL
tara:strand:+ start:613 stop:930 length:318 start_codon:yes stop_codon:yes gene_type:complete